MWTLEQGFEETYREYWARGRNQRAILCNAKSIMSYWEHATPLDTITTPKLYAWTLHLRTTNSQGTINRKLSVLSKIMEHAVVCGELAVKPLFPPQPQDKGGRDRFLSEEEESQALSEFGQDAADVFTALMDTGLRPSELWLILCRDCPGPTVTIWDTKTDKPRTLPATIRLQEIIARRKRGLAPDRPVFPFSTVWFEGVWNKMKPKIGLAEDAAFIPYSLRHTCASRLVEGGVPLAKVSMWLGHTSIKTTMRYAHLQPNALTEALNVLERGKKLQMCRKNNDTLSSTDRTSWR